MPRKTRLGHPGRTGVGASMRPRPDAAENSFPDGDDVPRPDASMRPRPDAAENRRKAGSDGGLTRRFNEAAARCRGKLAPTARRG